MNTNNTNICKPLSLLLFFSFIFIVHGKAQGNNNEFDKVDAYVQSLGSLDTLNMGTIADLVTKNFNDKKLKARAIFSWIANNIAYETKTSRATNPKNNTSDVVLKNRKAGGTGYATLFQDMCSVANIRCLTADGFLKRTVEEINEKDVEINHSWDVVQLGQSPDDWYYVDAALASGHLDKKGTTFIKSFEDDYFFADKTIFNYQHYPDNSKWQLGSGPRSKKSFYTLPIIKNGAYAFKVTSFSPSEGLIQTKAGKVVNFNCSAFGDINKVDILIEENKKQQLKTITNAVIKGGKVAFNYTFENEGSYTVTLLLNDKEVLQYLAEVQ